jgi:hypothetical protein
VVDPLHDEAAMQRVPCLEDYCDGASGRSSGPLRSLE